MAEEGADTATATADVIAGSLFRFNGHRSGVMDRIAPVSGIECSGFGDSRE